MSNYSHQMLLKEIGRLDVPPSDQGRFTKWIEAGSHLDFLEHNAQSQEIVIHASGPYTFVHSMIVPNKALRPIDEDDLLHWSTNPYGSIASYVWGGGKKGVRVERGPTITGSKTLNKGMDLVFGRTFQGWKSDDRTYFEINQEYT
jgi:hypothetical protein